VTDALLVLPVALPLATAAAAYALRARPEARAAVSVGGALAAAAAAAALFARVWTGGPVAAQLGGWPAPFAIAFVADTLAATMTLISALAGLAATVYALADVTEAEERRGTAAFLHTLLAGACGAFLTADLFNLYVWFEVTLISAFGLLVMRDGPAAAAGAAQYALLNLVATVAILAGVGLLYGATGALAMAELRGAVAGREGETAVLLPAALFLFAFSLKAGLFPLYFWLPVSYHTPPVAVSALFSALMTKVAVYALFRVFTLVYDLEAVPFLRELLLWTASATMLVGVLGAAAQNNVRRILAFHIVSQIGYMALGLALATPAATAGGLFYMAHNIAAKTNLFLAGGLARRLCGSEELARMGGLWAARPWLSLLFLVSALAMAGVPPLTGFWAKFFLVRETLTTGYRFEAALALAVGLLTLYSMTKIWAEAFWKPHPDPDWRPGAAPAAMLWPTAAIAAALVVAGVAVAPLHAVFARAAAELVDPAAYLAAYDAGRARP
jgi:multicomponent Na+:H+ antiporter subunit D